jgi:hypothetical protein
VIGESFDRKASFIHDAERIMITDFHLSYIVMFTAFLFLYAGFQAILACQIQTNIIGPVVALTQQIKNP